MLIYRYGGYAIVRCFDYCIAGHHYLYGYK